MRPPLQSSARGYDHIDVSDIEHLYCDNHIDNKLGRDTLVNNNVVHDNVVHDRNKHDHDQQYNYYDEISVYYDRLIQDGNIHINIML